MACVPMLGMLVACLLAVQQLAGHQATTDQRQPAPSSENPCLAMLSLKHSQLYTAIANMGP